MEIANPTKRYDSSHSLVYSCQDHVVFCPKFRRPIRAGEIEERLKELLLAGQQRDEYEWLEWEVMPDHVHLLLSVSPQVGVGPVVGRIKGWTAHVLRSEFPALRTGTNRRESWLDCTSVWQTCDETTCTNSPTS